MSWHTLLVLGGIGSGRSEYAESLTGRRPGTGNGGGDATGRAGGGSGGDTEGHGGDATEGGPRRVTAGRGDDLAGLSRLLTQAKPDETLLVEDLVGWLPGSPASWQRPPLVEAVRTSPARLVLVSTEVGLSVLPPAGASRDRMLAVGDLNHQLADAVDAVVLLVAGQPVWLKGGAAPAAGPVRATAARTPATVAVPDLSDLKPLAAPDESARTAATARLARLGPIRLGALEAVVGFAAATQGTAEPAPWRAVRVLVLHGDHAGAAATGAPASAPRAAQLREGTSPLAQLAGPAGAGVQVVEVATAAPIEAGPAMTAEAVEEALAYGWRLADQAADDGIDALVVGAIGAGAETAAAAVVSALAANAEPAALLARVRTADGMIDDQAWIARCAAVRDAVHRVRSASRATARPVLAELAGPDIATATGLVLGAAARRTPVLLDGPVGTAAALVARGLATQVRHWCLLPDHTGHPTVVRAAEALGLTPLLDLRLELGEGATVLATLPLLRSALTLPATLS